MGEAVARGRARRARPDDDDADGSVLDATLDALLAADFALKETRLSSDEQLLTNLVLTFCTPHEKRGGSYVRDNASGSRDNRATTAEHA